MSKLNDLSKINGMEVNEMLEEASYDGIAEGICTNSNCDWTCYVEPDQDKGWCELCNTNTVKSCLVLAGVI